MARRRARASIRRVRRRTRAISLSMAAVLAVGLLPFAASPAPAETTHTPLMGPAVVNASDLVAFFETKDVEAKTTAPIEDIARYYIEEGEAAEVRGDIAFVQALHETGWFQFGGDVEPEQNNFAGIGATGGGEPGNAFETAQEGVRAQIHHLKAYADPKMIEYKDYPDEDPGWLDPGPVTPIDEEKPRFTGLPEWWFGSVTTVEDLTGTWAADPEYHHKLLEKWDDLLLHAGKHDDLFPLTGDWNGDGRDTPGWYINGSVTLSGADRSSVHKHYTFGRAGDIPIVGDWDGDGVDTLGVVREGRWYLRNKHRGGAADLDFKYGRVLEGDFPLAGDWNGNGQDTVGIVRDGEWHLRNKNSGGPGQIVYKYGRVRQGDIPLMGDWSGDGQDTPAIVRGREWHLRYVHKAGHADHVFKYGASGDVPVTGDWNGDRVDTPGVVRGSDWLLRDRLSGGDAQIQTHFYAR